MRKIASLAGALLLCLANHAHAQSCQPAWDYHVPGLTGALGALAVFDDGSGAALYAGEGYFTDRNVQDPRWVMKWNGSEWSVVGGLSPQDSTHPAVVEDLAVFDDGSGPALYVAGNFEKAGGVVVNGIARWNGQAWSAVSGGVTGSCGSLRFVYDLQVYDDGTGPALYAAGNFLDMGGVPARGVAKWNGTTWSPLGSGIGAPPYCTPVLSLGVFSHNSVPELYAGGIFNEAGGAPGSHIAKWDGQSWSAVGAGISGYGGTFTTVDVMTTYDDGTGPALYVGGSFLYAGGQPADHIARWNGSAWSPLGAGLSVLAGAGVTALAAFDPGGDGALYAGGGFGFSGTTNLGRIAKWDGSQWLPLANGVRRTGDHSATVLALVPFDDGTGLRLYVGGDFTRANDQPANYIAAWMECALFDSVPTLSSRGAVFLAATIVLIGIVISRGRLRRRG